MITSICGEDTATSRNFFVQLKRQYTQKGFEIKDMLPADIYEIPKWLGEATSLFGTKQVFFVEKLESIIQRKRGRRPSIADPNSLEAVLARLASDRTIEIVDWEEKPAREIKIKEAQVKEFKPPQSIFKLLDSFSPGNKEEFIRQLRKLSEDQDDNFIFIMLYRHIRTLLMASQDSYAKTVQPWQRGKLHSQSMTFPPGRLTEIYKSCYRLELGNKTGTNPHGLRKGLEILACYYL